MRAARALAVAPESAAAVSLADRVLAAVPDALDRLPVGDGVSFGIVAMRARALAATGRFIDAADLALQLGRFRPQLAFVPWAAAMLDTKSTHLSRAEADRLLDKMTPLFAALQEADSQEVGARANAAATCDVLARIQPKTSSLLKASYLRSALLRRLGRTKEAVGEARRMFIAEACWVSAAELEVALRDDGSLEEALAMYRKAAALDPHDESVWVDMGNIFASTARWVEARGAYAEALARAANHAEARVGAAYARSRCGDAAGNAELERLATEQGDLGRLARQRLGDTSS